MAADYLYKVVLEGDEVEWVHRDADEYFELDKSGARKLDDDGNPIPRTVVKPARADVTLRARSDDEAKSIALRHNPDFHTVLSCEKQD